MDNTGDPKVAAAIWPWGVAKKEQMLQAMEEVSEIGYSYFESVKNAIDLYAGNLSGFQEDCERFGLKAVSFYFHSDGTEENDVVDLGNKMPFLAQAGVKRISLQAASRNHRIKIDQSELVDTLELINKAAQITKEYGVLPCIHPHKNTMVMYEDEIDFIMENTDPDLVAFGPDTAHILVAGADPLRVMTKHADRIKFIHLKDLKDVGIAGSDGVDEHLGVEVYKDFLELGEGDIDFGCIFELLRKHEYDGYLCTELDRTRYTNKASARTNYEFVCANY